MLHVMKCSNSQRIMVIYTSRFLHSWGPGEDRLLGPGVCCDARGEKCTDGDILMVQPPLNEAHRLQFLNIITFSMQL